ncbi:hypothetical protein H6P81_006128 [Aristolochia fimbriata]|uniref:RING-type domain-containing protein n=1 Tax=Aristolochia fimbriata TaxID=158543 RepID=A0AAV7EXG9_ARIFI|nr:hypothetical protein H6P81_006128 [Aristolochia fimbriata]
MPQRHSKHNAFFTYEEKRKLGYGTQKERIGKDSIKPFDACSLCLKPFIDPLCCHKGHIFCKDCIVLCLLAQKKEITRKLAAHAAQQRQEKEEEEEKLVLQNAQKLDAFDRQNRGAVAKDDDWSYIRDQKNGFQGANSVKITSFEEKALRNTKAFWLPSATPEAPAQVKAPPTDTVCPEGKEKLKLRTLFPIHFTEETSDHIHARAAGSLNHSSYICPSCKDSLTNTTALVAVSTCGHVFCKKCSDRFIAKDKICLVCNKECKEKNLVRLKKGGSGYSGHGDQLEATDFRHLGC